MDSCRNIALVDNHILRAECLTSDRATYQTSSLDLNRWLGNIEGEFKYGVASYFSLSAEHITLQGTVLAAALPMTSGSWKHARTDLNLHVANINGELSVTTWATQEGEGAASILHRRVRPIIPAFVLDNRIN